jgi:hypothetical protein
MEYLLRVYLGFELVPFESFFNMSDMRIFDYSSYLFYYSH